jgi:SOS-response transcriptional repressor LexA
MGRPQRPGGIPVTESWYVARKKTPTVRVNVKAQISARLREVRQELFGEHGGPELARRLGLPARTWYNYETGVTVPAEVLLSFIDQTSINPLWLLAGEGPKYRRNLEDMVLSGLTPEQLIRRGLEKLEQRPNELVLVAPENLPVENSSEFVAVSLIPLSALAQPSGAASAVEGHILAYRQWIPHPRETVAVRLEDEAMHPILPIGSVAAIDRAVTDPSLLQGRLVAAGPDNQPVIRWLEISGRHLILRPNQPSRDFPMIPLEWNGKPGSPILGQVVWSWSRFSIT